MRALILLLVLAAGLAEARAQDAPWKSGPWSFRGGDASHRGFVDSRLGEHAFRTRWLTRIDNSWWVQHEFPGNQVLAATGQVVAIADRTAVSAYDLATGRPLWKFESEFGVGILSAAPGRFTFVATIPERHLVTVSASTGSLLWKRELPNDAFSMLLPDEEGGVWGATTTWASHFDREGTSSSPISFAESFQSQPAYAAGVIHGTTGPGWYVQPIRNGEPRAFADLTLEIVLDQSPTMVSGSYGVAGSSDGRWAVVDWQNEKFLWTATTGIPALDEEAFYTVRGSFAYQHALADGTLIRRYDAQGRELAGQPIVFDDALLVSGPEETVRFALGSPDAVEIIPGGGQLLYSDGYLISLESDGELRGASLEILPAPLGAVNLTVYDGLPFDEALAVDQPPSGTLAVELISAPAWIGASLVEGRIQLTGTPRFEENEIEVILMLRHSGGGEALYRLSLRVERDAAPQLLPIRDRTLQEGMRLRLDAGPSGPEPMTMQWYKEGKPIEGATAARFEKESVRVADEGTYEFRVQGPGGTRSLTVNVRVDPPSRLAGPFARPRVSNGNNFYYPATMGEEPFEELWTVDDASQGWNYAVVIGEGFLYRIAEDPGAPGRFVVESRSLLSGQVHWSAPLNVADPYQLELQLVWHGGDVYVVAYLRAEEQLAAQCWRLDGLTGETLATAVLPDRDPFHRERVPLIDDLGIYFVTFIYDYEIFEHVAYLQAVDRLTLRPLYARTITMPRNVSQGPHLAMAHGIIYAMAWKRFLAIDARTGVTQWELDLEDDGPEGVWDVSVPSVEDDMAIVTLNFNTHLGIDLRRRSLAWRHVAAQGSYSVMGNGRLHVFTPGPWYQLDPQSGETLATLVHSEGGILTADRLFTYQGVFGLDGERLGGPTDMTTPLAFSDGYWIGHVARNNGPPLITAWTNWPRLEVSASQSLTTVIAGTPVESILETSAPGKLVVLERPDWLQATRRDDQRFRFAGTPLATAPGDDPVVLSLGLEIEGRVVRETSIPITVSLSAAPSVRWESETIRGVAGGSLVLRPVFGEGTATAFAWFHKDTPILGATGPTLRLKGLTASNAGDYRVEARNAFGAGSASVAVTVLPAVVSEGNWSIFDTSYQGRAFLPIAGAGETVPVWSMDQVNGDTLSVIDSGLFALVLPGLAGTRLEVRAMASGEVIWSHLLERAELGYGVFLLAANGRLVSLAGNSGGMSIGTYDIASGKLLWEKSFEPVYPQFAHWQLRGDALFQTIPGNGLTLSKWSAGSGELIYSSQLSEGDEALVESGTSGDYVVETGRVLSLNPVSGTLQWEVANHASHPSIPSARPALAGNHLLVTGMSQTLLLDAVTGAEVWRRAIASPWRAVTDEEILFADSGRPGITVLDFLTGEWLRSVSLPEKRLAGDMLFAAHDRFYLGTFQEPDPTDFLQRSYPRFEAFDLHTGESAAVILDGGTRILGVHEGYLLLGQYRVERWKNLPVLDSLGARRAYGGLSFAHERQLGSGFESMRVAAVETLPETPLPAGVSVRVTSDGRGLLYDGTLEPGADRTVWMRTRVTLASGVTCWDEWALAVLGDARPKIVQPVSDGTLRVEPGASFTLDWPVEGPGPIAYEWRRGDVVIASTRILTVSDAGADDAGIYTLVGSNGQGRQSASLVVEIATGDAAAVAWGFQHGNLQRTRAVDAILRPNGEMFERWARELGQVYGEVRTDSERAFAVCDGESGVAALRAWRLSDGEPLWENVFLAEGDLREDATSTVAAGDQVFVHYVRPDGIIELRVFAAATGQQLWSKITAASGFVREPMVEGDQVRIILGERPTALVAWNRHTGASLGALGNIARDTVASRDGDFLTGTDGPWQRVNGTTGATVWSRDRQHQFSIPMIAGDAALLPNNNLIEVVDWETGDFRYSIPALSPLGPRPSASDGRLLYFGDGLRLAELETGKLLASVVRRFDDEPISAAAFARNHIVAVGSRNVEILDKDTLATLASFQNDRGFNSFIPVNGGVLVHGGDHRLAFLATDGSGNQAPTVMLPELVRGREHEPLDFLIQVQDDGDLSALTLTSPDKPDWLNIELTPDGQIRLFTRIDFSAEAAVTLVVRDAEGSHFRGTLRVWIEEVDDPPTTMTGRIIQVEEDQEARPLPVAEWFADDEQGANLAYEVIGVTPADAIQVTTDFLGMMFQPRADFWGSASVDLKATDQGGHSVTNRLVFEVIPFPDAPRAVADHVPFVHGVEGIHEIVLTELFSDADGDALRFEIGPIEWVPLIESVSLDEAASILSIRYTPYTSGQTTIGIRGVDPSGLADEIRLDLSVPEFVLPEVTPGPFVLNRQTGLFEQRVRVVNVDSRTVGGFELRLPAISGTARLQHAVDVNEEGVATVRHEQLVVPNTEIEVTLNWYAPDRQVPVAVVIESALTFPSERLLESTLAQSSPLVDRIVKLAGGAVLIEFEAEPGRRYEVLYSDDGQEWKRALATPNAGAANRVQWLDQGSPATWPHPGDVPMRLYRFRPITHPRSTTP